MPLRKWLPGAAKRQARTLLNYANGWSVQPSTHAGGTLGVDDIRIASALLKEGPLRWGGHAAKSRYERRFAEWNGSQYAVALDSGRCALSAAITALELQPGDEVIVPGYTCVVVPNAFRFAGVKPVFCDIELATYGPDIDSVSRCITARTRAILVHHLYGLVSRDYEALLELARIKRLKVIEDCAQATGASLHDRKVGTRGEIGIYSSESSKLLSTGQGGLAVTNDPDLAARLRQFQQAAPVVSEAKQRALLRQLLLTYYTFNHPMRWLTCEFAELCYGDSRVVSTTAQELEGERPSDYGCQLPEPLAVIGLNQLRKLDDLNRRRRATARRWDDWAVSQGYTAPRVVEGSVPVFLRYPLLVEPARKSDTRWGRALGVDVGVWFKSPLHPSRQPVSDCPNALEAVQCCVNLPCLGGAPLSDDR